VPHCCWLPPPLATVTMTPRSGRHLVHLAALLVSPAAAVVVCGPGATCPDGNTCCPTTASDGRGGATGWACCADEESGQGVCCGDGKHCCANGYTCQLGGAACLADEPKDHPLATRTNLYSLCPADIPAAPHEFSGLVDASPLSLPYYSSPAPLGEPDAEAQLAVIVVHGSERNADDYFCSMQEARNLQTSYDPAHVIVVAPRFTEPRDKPSPTWFTWNGSDYGDWRKGGNSTLEGGRASLSSYAVLDKIIALLSNSHLYPKLEQIVVTGHSAGGQTVQRYALVTRSPPTAPIGSPKLRFVVANPSSFGYLNARCPSEASHSELNSRFRLRRDCPEPELTIAVVAVCSRWDDTSNPTNLILPNSALCPDYNMWHYGFGGRFTPFVSALTSRTLRLSYRCSKPADRVLQKCVAIIATFEGVETIQPR
jgi:pimeloyl-ACP methyl ester carboxylesterase